MRRSGCVAVLTAVASLLAACGGTNDDTSTGVFVGPIVGLRYETQTRNGLTSASGEFTYADGERVSFSVGGVLLGSAPGAARISAFDLFGAEVVTDVVALRRLLTDRVITPFDRAANVTFFLQALDDDRDPSNGIDVTAWGASLAGQSLGFGSESQDFPYGKFRRFASVHGGIDRHLDPAAPLTHLYAQLGLSVVGYARSTLTVDSDADGVIDQRGTYTVDARGRETREVLDNDGNGVIDRDNSSVYDARGAATNHTFRSDIDGDGTLERVELTERTFDADGNLVAGLVQNTTNGIIGLKQTYTITYDLAGNSVDTQQSNDNGGNGSVESGLREKNTYDAVGRVISTRRESDIDGNGTPNRIDVTTQTWNDTDQVTSRSVVSDTNGDGTVEMTTNAVSTYDAAGDLVAQTSEQVVAGVTVARETVASTYDPAGHRLTSIVDDDYDGDGIFDYQSRAVDTYTADGRRLVETTESDAGHDGTIDGRVIRTNTYDAAMNVVAMVIETDNDADGVIDALASVTFTRDASGNMLTRHGTSDFDGDGTLDSDSLATYEYSEIADGLYALLYQTVVD